MKVKKINKIKWIGFKEWAVLKKMINKNLKRQIENQSKGKETVLKDGECPQPDQLKFYKWMIKLFKKKIGKNVKKLFSLNFNTEDDSAMIIYFFY